MFWQGPGSTHLTEIRWGFSSLPSTLVSIRRSAFNTQYAELPASPEWPSLEPTVMILACSAFSRSGKAANAQQQVPVKFTSITFFQLAGLLFSSLSRSTEIPAFRKRISILWWEEPKAEIVSETASKSLTSEMSASALPPELWISSTVERTPQCVLAKTQQMRLR